MGTMGTRWRTESIQSPLLAAHAEDLPMLELLSRFVLSKRALPYGVAILSLFCVSSFLALFGPVPDFRPGALRLAEDSSLFSVIEASQSSFDEAVSERTAKASFGAAVSYREHKVQSGETIKSIAAKYGKRVDSIISINGISNAKRLSAGDILKIPSIDGVIHVARSGESYSRVAASYGVSLNALLDANATDDPVLRVGAKLFIPGAAMGKTALLKSLGELFARPVASATLSSKFGYRNDPFTGKRAYHNGIDLAAEYGTRISAALDGKVSLVGYSPIFGKYVIVSHDGGYQTWYAHLSAFSVKEGDRVTQGQKLGEMGSTGYSTGTHLHFSVYLNGKALDPLGFVSY